MKRAVQGAVVLVVPIMVIACSPRDDTAAPPDVAAPPADALRTESGIASRMIRVGLGSRRPTSTSQVTVHYTGWTTDGEMFDTSIGDTPPTFLLDGVIPGWTEGVQLMVEGEKRRFWIPGHLAYDNSPREDAPRGTLVFDIELIRIR
ncbi:MAG TPA: FKBP-type peptidyl-prolyl cis-trans isomerase [Vicinamibacterales bacterium]|nr:FKBP-type peptidyl-prolyl cis-trans isomerase [Vicinamibacterales bacterium]